MKLLIFIIVLLYAYPIGFIGGSILLRKILIFVDETNREYLGGSKIKLKNVGFWIGMCEHFLVVTFILVGQYTALGIIVAARGLLRTEDIKKSKQEKGSYFLIGMLLSISFATFFGLTSKLLLILLNYSLPAL